MSLSKQLLLLLSVIFFILLSATLIISINNIKNYLEVESQFHVQDTATLLGLSLSPHIQNEQDPILKTMMTAIFDTGYYQEMRLVDIEGKELVTLTNSEAIPGVPSWLPEYLPMQLATATTEINSGWHMTGKLYVTANPRYGYLKLYQQVQSTLIVAGLIFLAAIVLLVSVLRITLKPLNDISKQAEQISSGHFTTITQLPWTHEVKQVALSMNSMSDKIGQTINRLNKRVEVLGESLKRDPLTQLLNSNTFDIDVKKALSSNKGNGFTALIKFDDLGQLTKEKGNDEVNKLLKEFAAILNSMQSFSCSAYRLQGSEFALLFPRFQQDEVIKLIKQLKFDVTLLGKSFGHPDLVHIGVIQYQRSIDFDKLYPAMVEAYEHAKIIGSNAYYLKQDLTSPMSDIEWKTLITSAIEYNTPIPEITFTTQAYDPNQVDAPKVMEEAFTRVKDKQGQPLAIGTFFSMAQEFNLVEALDQSIVTKVISLMEQTKYSTPLTINLSVDSVASHNFKSWLADYLTKSNVDRSLLAFSVTAYSATKDINAFADFTRFIKQLGAKILLKRYSPDIIDIEQLKTLNLDYIRLSRDLTQDIPNDSNKTQFLDLITEIANLLNIKVLAEGVQQQADLDMLKAKAVHGVSR